MSGTWKQAPILAAALALSACGGGSTSGAGTADSPFVGRYTGSTVITVSAPGRSQTVRESVSIFVNQDGLVQFGDAESTIYASGPLHGSRVRIASDAAALVSDHCSGTITLAGSFSRGPDDAAFEGQWSSINAACFGVSGDVSGPFVAERASPNARASRVFETYSPALLRAFEELAG